MILKNIAIVAASLIVSNGLAQTVLITDADYSGGNACDCANVFNDGSVQNFHDDGGPGGNYSANANDEIVFCPGTGGNKVTLAVGINAGYTWDVHSSDTLYVYDGPTTASPLIVAGNTNSHPTGFSGGLTTASWTNASGCLTVKFVSDATDDGTGWDANITCSNKLQPFDIHMEAYIGAGEANGAGDLISDFTDKPITGPALDSGYVNVCLGDSILFVNTTEYPFEPMSANPDPNIPVNGNGYNQSNNSTALWTFSDGSSAVGDSVWFTPTARTGYYVQLEVTDPQQQFQVLASKVRVSTIPSFETCAPVDDSICVGSSTQLIGGITAGDTAGVDAVSSTFPIQGSFGAQTYLPDGSGQNYTTDINITGFPAGLTLQNIGDLDQVCVSMEHSYLGDLEMMLTCPNGQFVNIFNSYNGFGGGELFPGGFGGGNTFLGGAFDNNIGNLGQCEEYCFSEATGANPPFASGFGTTAASGPSVGNMITPGLYEPEESFITALNGCPLNGTWTLTVRDNLGIDDGFICEWGIFFNASLNPNNENYSPTIVSEMWQPDPTILAGGGDTAVIVTHLTPNTYGYTFEVEDNFGCTYDTTINVVVEPRSSITPADTTCDDSYQFDGTNTNIIYTGLWSYTGSGSVAFSPSNPAFKYPSVTPDGDGEYTFTYIDDYCGDTLNSSIYFASLPDANTIPSQDVCEGDTAVFSITVNEDESVIWTDVDGNVIASDTVAFVFESGTYTATISNACGTDNSPAVAVIEPCSVPNVITANGDGNNDTFFTNYATKYDDVVLIIYNRWGRVVYSTDSYKNTWSGQKNNGGKVTPGTYFYVMNWDGGTSDEAGTITVFE